MSIERHHPLWLAKVSKTFGMDEESQKKHHPCRFLVKWQYFHIAKYFANFLLNPITPHAIMNLMWKSLGRMMVVQETAHVLDGFFKGCGLSWDCYE